MSRRSSSTVRIRALIAATALICAATVTASARAVPSFTLERTTLGGGIRWGSDEIEFGIGVRGGYTLSQGIYIGGLFDYWFGDDEESEFVGGIGRYERDVNVWNLMGVVGYDAGITPSITIRPYGGFGIVHVDFEECGGALGLNPCIDGDETDPGMVLGGEALFEIGTSLHVGPELRILIFEETAFIIGGNFGGTF